MEKRSKAAGCFPPSQTAHRKLLIASASIMALALAGYSVKASAQQADAASGGIGEIVVTAQKREQSLQDVPIAVTALGEDVLQTNRVQSTMDLTGLAPGLLSRVNAGGAASASYSMRGVFATASLPGADRQVATYVDGVFIGSVRGSVFDLPDLQRIEVLRGPQGTLFGRNATAGAISVVTRDPTGEFGIRQEVTVGNYEQLRTRTSLDLPQMGPFSAYFTYLHDERRGDVRNLGAGTTFDRTSPFRPNIGVTSSPKWLGGKNAENIFAAVKFEPSDSFTMTYKFDRTDAKTSPTARVSSALNPQSFIGGLLTAVLQMQPTDGGRFGPTTIFPEDKRPKAVNNAFSQMGYTKAYGHNLTTEWQVSDGLSIKNITAYRQVRVYGPSSIMGVDGLEYTAAAKAFFTSPQAFLGGGSYAGILRINGDQPIGSYFAGYASHTYGRYHQISSELQANYDSNLLTLTAGALWYRSKELNSGVTGFSQNFSWSPIPTTSDLVIQLPLGRVEEGRAKVTSIAAYAQAEVHVTPELDVTLGGRITRDKKSGSQTSGGTFTDGQIVGANVIPWTYKKSKPTYLIGVNYKPSSDLLLFAKYSTAFLSGGAIGTLPWAPETVASWEAGIKADLLDRRLRVNLAVYHAKYKHSQSSQSGLNAGHPELPVVIVDNGPIKAKGFELEITAAPVDGLTFGGSVGYTDSKLADPSPLVAQGREYLQSGIPKWTANLNAQYVTQPLFGDASVLFRLDANHTGRYRATPFTDIATAVPVFAPYEYSPSRWILNGRVALRDIEFGRANVEVGLWARNLTNNKDPLYSLVFGDIERDASYQPARTWGVDLIVGFR